MINFTIAYQPTADTHTMLIVAKQISFLLFVSIGFISRLWKICLELAKRNHCTCNNCWACVCVEKYHIENLFIFQPVFWLLLLKFRTNYPHHRDAGLSFNLTVIRSSRLKCLLHYYSSQTHARTHARTQTPNKNKSEPTKNRNRQRDEASKR